ncbi:ABC transporter substrate binding protein [Oceanicoccus sagamiensis]|uniref:ABC transporter substrate binding protein n=1 Tax=Oceanicoccus sagamiensis TaxID=716816 RepID=UPI00146ADAF0|nr:ABC transporter substrate binding protein [Oceanicoccus sagamiensis]
MTVPARETVSQPAPVLKPQPAPKVVEPVAILLNENNPNSQQIADLLTAKLTTPTQLYYLSALPQQQVEVVAQLQQQAYSQVVAIGSNAALRAKSLDDSRVVFSQVFNYQDEGLIEAGFSGVSMVPSAEKLFSEWKQLTPGLKHIAIITGPNNQQQIARIQQAAKHHGVVVLHREVNNDKEMLYEAKQLAPLIQGFWLLPDNRVLSRRSIKEFMAQSMKQGKQVALFNRQLFKYGGLLYVGGDVDEIAEQLKVQLATTEQSVFGLKTAKIEINQRAAEQLLLVRGEQ